MLKGCNETLFWDDKAEEFYEQQRHKHKKTQELHPRETDIYMMEKHMNGSWKRIIRVVAEGACQGSRPNA